MKSRKIVSSIAFYVFLALVVLYLPKAIYQSAEFERRAIFSTFGIDKAENGYEVSGLVVIEASPNQISSNTQIVSAKGRDVSEALYKMSTNLGKEIGFAHCDTFIISDSLKDDDVAKILDFCIRGSSLTQNAKLLTCKGSAKEVIEVNMQKKDQIGTSLARSITTSSDYLAISDVDLKEFYNRYYSKSGMAWMTVVKVAEDESANQEGASQEQESGGKDKPKTIKSEGEVAFYKKGKLMFIAEGDLANFINIMNPYSQMGYLYLENIQDGDKLIEKASIQIVQKETSREYYYEDGRACTDFNIKLYLNLLSMRTNEENVEEISETTTHISDNLINAITEYMQRYKEVLYDIAEETKTDVFKLNQRLYQLRHKEWEMYTTEEEKSNFYIENSKVNLNVEIETKL